MKRRPALLTLLLLVGGCATATESGRQPADPPATGATATPSPTPGPGFNVDPRFATVEVNEDGGIPDTGLRGVKFRLDGNCTYAEYVNGGPRTLLIWPEGHVRYNATTGAVWFVHPDPRGVVEFDVDDVLDVGVILVSRDQGYVPLSSLDFVNPPDPSCEGGPDQYVALVTGVIVHD